MEKEFRTMRPGNAPETEEFRISSEQRALNFYTMRKLAQVQG
jgi:hypothetical protein